MQTSEDQNIDETTRRILLEKILGSRIKNTSPNQGIQVPRDLLRRYYNDREKYRSIVPNDTIYFGKLKDIDFNRIDFWDAVEENVQIDVTSKTSEETPSYVYQGQWDDYGLFPAEVEAVPERVEVHLPPNYYGEDQKFQSARLKFDISSITTDAYNPWTESELVGAELSLYREQVPGIGRNQSYQKVYILVINSMQEDYIIPLSHVIDTHKIDISRTGSLHFDVTDVVRTWLRNGNNNHGFYVRVTSFKSNDELLEHVRLLRQFRNSSDSEERWSDVSPKLYLYKKSSLNETDSSIGGKRDRRQVSHSRSGHRMTNKGSKCSLKSYTIRFDDIGWSNWIIAPSELKINLCSGDCSYPIADAQKPVNHAIVQALFAQTFRSVPRPPCVPIDFSPIALLYQIDNTVRIRTYNDIIAESCGCV